MRITALEKSSCCNPTKLRSNNHKLKTAAAVSRNVIALLETYISCVSLNCGHCH
ncbi:hypothetical protein [Nostoc sp.]|uniref:hypothetical protein n=1 Tax=Nostoc sp. TaxID=1180 RepID=UPI003FA548BB